MENTLADLHASLEIRAHFKHKEHTLTIPNPSDYSLHKFKEDLTVAFTPAIAKAQDKASSLPLHLSLQYLEASQLLQISSETLWQTALQSAHSQSPPFLHIFCTNEQIPAEKVEIPDVHPENIPLPESDEEEPHMKSMVHSASFGQIIEEYLDMNIKVDKADGYQAPLDNASETFSLISEVSTFSQTDELRPCLETLPAPETNRSTDESHVMLDKAIQSTPLAGLNSKTIKKKTPSNPRAPVPWNKSINARDLRNPEFETKLSLIDERANLTPSLSMPPPAKNKSKMRSSPTSSPVHTPFTLEFARDSRTPSPQPLDKIPPVMHADGEQPVKTLCSRPPLHPIPKSPDIYIPSLQPSKQIQMETIQEEDGQKGGAEEMSPQPELLQVEEKKPSDYYLNLPLPSVQSEYIHNVNPPSIYTERQSSPNSRTLNDAGRDLGYPSLMHEEKIPKPILRTSAHGDISTKHITFVEKMVPTPTSPSPSPSSSPDHPRSILKKVSIAVNPPAAPSRNADSPVRDAPKVEDTHPHEPPASSATKEPNPPSPSYVLVPANLLPSLFPVLPPIASLPYLPSPTSPNFTPSYHEQKLGLPPRPKSMLEYSTQPKFEPPRPFSATPTLSYYEQYLLSRKGNQ